MIVKYGAQAARDLEQIARYYVERLGPAGADRLVRRIVDTLERVIALNPNAGRSRPDLGSGTRSFPVLPYVVFYRIQGRRVYVQRILHGHRDIRPPLASLLAAV